MVSEEEKMTRAQFKELERILEGIDVLVLEVDNAKERKPLSESSSRTIARNFAALKESAFVWIRNFITPNTLQAEKTLLKEIAAGLRGIESVNSQFAPAKMIALIRRLRSF